MAKLCLIYKKTQFFKSEYPTYCLSKWIQYVHIHTEAQNVVQTHTQGKENTNQSRCLCMCVVLINEFWFCICCSIAVCRADLGINWVGGRQKNSRSILRTPQLLFSETQKEEITEGKSWPCRQRTANRQKHTRIHWDQSFYSEVFLRTRMWTPPHPSSTHTFRQWAKLSRQGQYWSLKCLYAKWEHTWLWKLLTQMLYAAQV